MPTPLSPRAYLAALLRDPEDVRRIYARVRTMHPPFPDWGNAPFVARLLFEIGLPGGYDPIPARMARKLVDSGWRPVPITTAPLPGDLFLARNDQGRAELGVVVGIGGYERGHVLVADHTLESHRLRPYRRRIDGADGALPITAWLRIGGT